jgi:PIN domain nuclease of toxin-antitoxin system
VAANDGRRSRGLDRRKVRVLTDTHSLVWALSSPHLLSKAARKVLAEANVSASVANLWELCLKANRKEALLLDPLPWWDRYVTASGIEAIPIRAAHVTALGSLADIHKDPFDRILVAQSLVERLPLVSRDAHLAKYGIEVIW